MSDALSHPHAGDVLVVDDDPAINDALVNLLTYAGYKVRHTSSAIEALTMIADWPPAVLLLDFMMPGMDGGQLIMELRARSAMFPIAIITAWPALAVPFLDQQVICVEKPFDSDVLMAWVAQYLPHARTC